MLMTVSEYIKKAPKEVQKKLKEMQKAIRSGAPKATEGMKWSLPSFSQERILVIYGAFKNHIGFYPTPTALKVFAKDLKKYKTAKGSVQFPLDMPIPTGLIKKMTAYRVKECVKEDRKWKD